MCDKKKFDRKAYNKRYYELHKDTILKKKKKDGINNVEKELWKYVICNKCLEYHSPIHKCEKLDMIEWNGKFYHLFKDTFKLDKIKIETL